jgi:beta-lactamase regulating signal transducer with metallopeptidase domain
MEYFLPLAVKSLLIAGGTLLLLKLMQKRSSSDRSWVAHLGLLAILLLPLAAVTLPALQVVGPDFLATDTPVTEVASVRAPTERVAAPEVAPASTSFPEVGAMDGSAVDWAFWSYVGPAALLLLLTLIALGRLSILKGRANVLVDAHWLQALARAQQRMGFKNGTALLTSNELSSPISWGLMRPVILLNTDATNAKDEAEAIIAHELAHVAGLDWAKLMLSRITVALFWFNPLVWLLAREAHQLREEAADDAVLAAHIEDTEYANLLVGIARHECRGMLLGAHGVAPGKGSLTRRVKRVLDAALDRAPGGWKWSSAAAFFAAGMTVPVAALQFVAPSTASAAGRDRPVADVGEPAPIAKPADPARTAAIASYTASRTGQTVALAQNDKKVVIGKNGSLDAQINATVAQALAQAGVATTQRGSSIDRAIELKALGATPEYVREMRSITPRLSHDDIAGLAALGVSPAYVRDLYRSTDRKLDVDDIQQARALGIDGSYIRGMAAAGYGALSIDDLSSMRAVGLTPHEVARYRRANRGLPSVDTLVGAKASGLTPEDLDPDDRE